MDRVKCRVVGCTNTHARSMLMCKTHWYKVSEATRNAVWKHWKAQNIREWDAAQKQAFTEVYQNLKRGEA